MKRLTIAMIGIVILAAGSWQLFGDTPQQPPQRLKPFMQQKLDHSKNILEALATEDFEKMNQSAQALSLLSLESNWNVFTTQEFIEQSADFRRACSVIQDAAKEENVDRAALAFVNLTVNCVECHKYLRKHAGDLQVNPERETPNDR